MEYATRLRKLWEQRPNRPLKNPFPRVIIGKSIKQTEHNSEREFGEAIILEQHDVESFYMPYTPELKKQNIKLLKKSKSAS